MDCKVRWLQLQYHKLPMYIVIKKTQNIISSAEENVYAVLTNMMLHVQSKVWN